MKRYGPSLLVLAASGVLLTGCVPDVGVRAVPAGDARSAAPGATAAPAGPAPIEDFRAALRKTHSATYKYTVSSQLPDKQRVAGSGTFDRKGRKLSTTMKY